MKNFFQDNLKQLTTKYTQKYVANITGFSQSSINNYIAGTTEPSIQFLIALKNAFQISIEDFLFSSLEIHEEKNMERYMGTFMIYYYNNDSYKGEVHINLKNTLNFGVLSVFKESTENNKVQVLATFTKSKTDAIKLFGKLKNLSTDKLESEYVNFGNNYSGSLNTNEQNIFFELDNKEKQDKSFIILNNPPSKAPYIGGVGTVNSISRGREHNPCVQFVILSKKILDIPDGEIYNVLKFNDYYINIDDSIKEIIEMFKRLYVEKNEISVKLSENQKMAIVKNKIEFLLDYILDSNSFRFAKISNKEDDLVYRLIKESSDV